MVILRHGVHLEIFLRSCLWRGWLTKNMMSSIPRLPRLLVRKELAEFANAMAIVMNVECVSTSVSPMEMFSSDYIDTVSIRYPYLLV